MDIKRKVMLAITGVCFVAATAFAAGVPEVIKMETKGYKKHKKGIVTFSHKKHSVDYVQKAPELFKDKCGACHHDADHKPLVDLKEGDKVQLCIECHKTPGEVPRKIKAGWKKKKIKRAEQKKLALAYHAEAMHYNCKGCHRSFNKANKTKAAPTTCTKCHPKKKKK